jgi:hypothetical protein
MKATLKIVIVNTLKQKRALFSKKEKRKKKLCHIERVWKRRIGTEGDQLREAPKISKKIMNTRYEYTGIYGQQSTWERNGSPCVDV